MDLAVKYYNQVANPQGIPGWWPAEVRELADGASPPDDDWYVMSLAGYGDWIERHQAEYDDWARLNPKPVAPPQEDPMALIADLQAQVAALQAAIQAQG